MTTPTPSMPRSTHARQAAFRAGGLLRHLRARVAGTASVEQAAEVVDDRAAAPDAARWAQAATQAGGAERVARIAVALGRVVDLPAAALEQLRSCWLVLDSGRASGPLATWIEHRSEHWDGTGGPAGLAGREIPLPARILGVAAAVEASRGQVGAVRALAGSVLDPTLVEIACMLLDGGQFVDGGTIVASAVAA